MSRVAKAPVVIPAGVEVKLNGQEISVKVKTASWLVLSIKLLKLSRLTIS